MKLQKLLIGAVALLAPLVAASEASAEDLFDIDMASERVAQQAERAQQPLVPENSETHKYEVSCRIAMI